MGKVYLVMVKNLMDTFLMGVFTNREDAEKQKTRLDELFNRKDVFTFAKTEAIAEVPMDSTECIDKAINEMKKELTT